jgi:hypothetical protein
VSKWDKFRAYWEELGQPELERRQQGEEAWNSLAAVDFKFCGCCEYRIAGDRHWELRLKWVNSDKTLPIEYKVINEWVLCCESNPAQWYQDVEYREAEIEEYKINMISESVDEILEKDPGAHYRYEYKVNLTPEDIARGFVIVKLDPFRIAEIYRMTDFAMKTVLKKCLCAGGRGYKDLRQDLKDIIGAAQRRLEMITEDEANAG